MPDDEETIDPATIDPKTAYCRHCGLENPGKTAGSDFLCQFCDGYQDTLACPTCHQPTRISLLPEGTAPPAHAPSRRKKG